MIIYCVLYSFTCIPTFNWYCLGFFLSTLWVMLKSFVTLYRDEGRSWSYNIKKGIMLLISVCCLNTNLLLYYSFQLGSCEIIININITNSRSTPKPDLAARGCILDFKGAKMSCCALLYYGLNSFTRVVCFTKTF